MKGKCAVLQNENKTLKNELAQEQKKNKHTTYIKNEMPEGLRALYDSHESNVSAKKAQGRRWTLTIKLLALNILRRGPQAYMSIQSLLFTSLPTIATILLLSRDIDIGVGIGMTLMDALTQKSEKMSELDRHCVLLFDEMSIKPRLLYDAAKDRVIGYQDYGKEMPHLNDKPKVATKALTFMIRGLNSDWKQPFAYYFNEKGIPSQDLIVLIPKIINAVNATGLKVRGIVADQASTNEKALNTLISGDEKIDTKEYPYFFIGNESKNKVYVIFDWPHMIKCFRNN